MNRNYFTITIYIFVLLEWLILLIIINIILAYLLLKWMNPELKRRWTVEHKFSLICDLSPSAKGVRLVWTSHMNLHHSWLITHRYHLSGVLFQSIQKRLRHLFLLALAVGAIVELQKDCQHQRQAYCTCEPQGSKKQTTLQHISDESMSHKFLGS